MSHTETHLITCSRDTSNELVAAECETLTGGSPDEWGVAVGGIENVRQGAFLKSGVEQLAHSDSLPGLARDVAALGLSADGFRIEWLAAGCGESRRWEAIVTLADQLPGRPDLKNPRERFLLLARKDSLSFGRIMVEPDRSYRQHDRKPWRTSTSLPAQLARALVNLVTPYARTLIDPCCGTGSILLEAASLGLRARGGDRNPRMVGMSRHNVAHFGYETQIDRADARDWRDVADAVVTDLPYGRGLEVSEEAIRDIVARVRRIAPVAVFVAGEDISSWLRDAGYGRVETYRVPKTRAFRRYIHRAWSDGCRG